MFRVLSTAAPQISHMGQRFSRPEKSSHLVARDASRPFSGSPRIFCTSLKPARDADTEELRVRFRAEAGTLLSPPTAFAWGLGRAVAADPRPQVLAGNVDPRTFIQQTVFRFWNAQRRVDEQALPGDINNVVRVSTALG